MTASQVATKSGIGREETYRAMSKLQELGLIDKTLATPTKFSATPTKLAIEILLERKEKSTRELKAKTERLLE